MFKSKQNALTKEEITKISEDISRQMIEKHKNEISTTAMTKDQITEISDVISREIIVKQSEEMMERMKKYCDADEKIDTVGRMAFIINECNKFTKDYVTEMLAKVFSNNQ